MEQLSRSFRLQQDSSSIKLCRSDSSLLISESISKECARVAGYERLSESMRLGNERVLGKSRSKKIGPWGILSKVLSFRKDPDHVFVETKMPPDSDGAEKKKKNVKKRSRWLPDPERRWPVQGW